MTARQTIGKRVVRGILNNSVASIKTNGSSGELLVQLHGEIQNDTPVPCRKKPSEKMFS